MPHLYLHHILFVVEVEEQDFAPKRQEIFHYHTQLMDFLYDMM